MIRICRYLVSALLALLSFSGWADISQSVCLDSVMLDEAVVFSARLPEGLQQLQRVAVEKAIGGNTDDLNAVRASRNMAPSLPIGIETIDLEGGHRLYRPCNKEEEKLRCLIYFHGGGWCFGSVNSCANICSEIALNAGIAVLAVDYPLSPETRYPDTGRKCGEIYRWIAGHAQELGIDKARLAIGGDSAGGNLALSMAMMFKDGTEENPAPVALVLYYPVTKQWGSDSSWQRYGSGYGLDADLMQAFIDAYGADPLDPMASPLLAEADMLQGLCPVLIINAGNDILRDQGKSMARLLSVNGVPVQHEEYAGASHLFITVPGQPTAFQEALRQTVEFLNHRL